MLEALTVAAPAAGRGVRIGRLNVTHGASVETVLAAQDVRCIAVHPDNESEWYAGTQGNGVFKTVDAGVSWKQIGLSGTIVKSLAIAPDTLYAGTKPARVYVSNDQGASWQERESFQRIPGRRLWWSPAESPGKAYVQSLAVSPTDPEVVLAGIEFGAVVRSEDGGRTWSRHLKNSLRDCHMMSFHHSDGSWIYEAGGTGGGASFSKDGGVTWAKAKEGLDRNYAVACASDPLDPHIWYLSAAPGPGKAHSLGNAQAHIFRANDREPWVKLNGGLPQPMNSMPYGLATIPDRAGTVIASLKNGDVWCSESYGDDWEKWPHSLGPVGIGLHTVHRTAS